VIEKCGLLSANRLGVDGREKKGVMQAGCKINLSVGQAGDPPSLLHTDMD